MMRLVIALNRTRTHIDCSKAGGCEGCTLQGFTFEVWRSHRGQSALLAARGQIRTRRPIPAATSASNVAYFIPLSERARA
jgi:hypothetical protein